MTKFFEPISVSATHIYHSALELSPEFSTVRTLYYDRRPTPLPRVATGITDSWDLSIDIFRPDYPLRPSIWSPCGRFVTAQAKNTVGIWDSLTTELLSTLHPDGSTPQLKGTHAYSPDGHSLASASDTTIVIWDIQTGGVAKEIKGILYNTYIDPKLVWSLDGRTICTMTWDHQQDSFTVWKFDVVSGTEQSSITSYSQLEPHLWAHNKSFRVMTTVFRAEADQVRNCIIDIFEVGPTLTRIESFDVRVGENDWWIMSFSPTTYRISVSILGQDRLLVLDIRNSGRLLDGIAEAELREFESHCFSPDGGFFAASRENVVQIWKYDGSSYVAWRKLPAHNYAEFLLFSPTSLSVLGVTSEVIQVWHLDDLPLPPTYRKQFGVFPRSGAYRYLVTTSNRGNTITITDVLSRTPLQLIHTGIEICELELTGNVLLVAGLEVVVAWLLTEEGLVNGVFGGRIAGRGDSIWTVHTPEDPLSRVKCRGETVVIETDDAPHVYNTRTGEALELSQTAPDWSSWSSWSSFLGASAGNDWDPLRDMTEGWVGDRGGRHLLWLPAEWRNETGMEWFSDVAIIQVQGSLSGTITIKLY